MSQTTRIARTQWLPIAIAALCATALAVLLFAGVQRAARLQSASTALQVAASLSAQPQLTRSELTLIQRGLETQTYVGDSLRTLAASRTATNQSFAQLAIAMGAAGLGGDSDALAQLRRAQELWAPMERGLQALAAVQATELYADSAGGSTLAPAGAQLKRDVDALLVAQSGSTTLLTGQLVELAAQLRAAVVTDGSSLRALLLGGSALATLLLATMLYFSWRASQAALRASNAQRQVANILGTVREGLFLIGRDGQIGAEHSASLRTLLRTATPAGQSFEQLLRPLVDDKTLVGATRYLGLLWKDKVNEELIESVNPLSQIEVNFARDQAPPEVRFLSFSFRRVRGARPDAGTDAVLGVVADVTERVLLQRELEQLKTGADNQSGLLLQLLQVEPVQLNAFLDNMEAALQHSNTLLRAPGKRRTDLEQKIHGVFREMHAIKGEAAALGMGSFVQRAHAIEELLAALRQRTTLAGNDFVPVVVKLDELLDHVHEVASLQERVGTARSVAASIHAVPDRHGETTLIATAAATTTATNSTTASAGALPATAAAPPSELELLLRRLATEVGAGAGREVRLATEGLELIPQRLAGRVREICVQMLRNAIVHGIETPVQRSAAGKSPAGTVRIRFLEDSAEGYSLLVEDDGQGLNPDLIRARARERGMIDAEQAAQLDRSGAFRLLFQPGFSTAPEVSEHAGRGVGLDVVNAAIRECGGRIGIATQAGKYTRFKMILPRQPATRQSTAA